jgi:hypothetical protein
MSVVIGEFEVVSEPEVNRATSDAPTEKPPAVVPPLTPNVFLSVQRVVIERLLRTWAD